MKDDHNTKHLIRDAARSLFAKHGYNGVSMREIAQSVGKQPGGIYNHFPNKQAILVDLMQENLSRAHKAVIAPLDDELAPPDRLEQFVRSHVLYNMENPDDIFIAYMELRSLEPDGAAHILKERNDYESALRAILRDGQNAGIFRISDPAIHARSVLSMLGGVTVWFRQSGPQSPTDVVECYVQAALQSAGAAYSAPSER